MSTISRHILRQLLLIFLVIIGIFTIVIWMINALKLFETVLSYGFSWLLFFQFSLLPAPKFLSVFLPPATFLTILFCYARMQRESEITALKAGGMSVRDIARPAMIFAIIVTLLGYLITLYILPWGARHFQTMRAQLKDTKISTMIRTGSFIDIDRHFTFYIRKKNDTGGFNDIFIHDARNPEEPMTIIAQTGSILDREGGVRFILEQGSRQSFQRQEGDFSILDFDSYTFDLMSRKNPTTERWRRIEEYGTLELIFPNPQVAHSPQRQQQLRAHLHYRILLPLLSVIFAWVALYATLRGAVPRQSPFRRYALVTGAMFLMEILFLSLSRYSENYLLGIGLIYLFMATAGYFSYQSLYRRKFFRIF